MPDKKRLPAREDFIRYLRDSVLPEFNKLRAYQTIDDFETALRFIEDEDRRHPEDDALPADDAPPVLH